MLKAKDALNISFDNSEKARSILEKVDKKIRETAQKGGFHILVYTGKGCARADEDVILGADLSTGERQFLFGELERNGYSCRYMGSGYSYFPLQVSWGILKGEAK